MKARTKMIGLALLAVALSAGGLPTRLGHAAPHGSYRNRTLQVVVPGPELRGRIDYLLNRHVSGYVINTKSQTAYIKNFRSSFGNRVIKIRFDYDIKRRGWTSGPFGRIYGPWVKDSGWIEVDVRTGVGNGMLFAYTRNGYVRWGSNNWFTNQFRSLFDQKVRDNVADNVNAAVAQSLGGRKVPLADVLLRYGAADIARAFGVSRAVAENTIRSAIRRTNPSAYVTAEGLVIQLAVPRTHQPVTSQPTHQPVTSQVWIYNQTRNPIFFQISRGGGRFKSYRVEPNRRWRFSTTANPPRFVVKFDWSFAPFFQERRYGLRPNSHNDFRLRGNGIDLTHR